MKNYNELIKQLDSSGARYSQELSEVDLTDAEDVKVLASDPNGEVLVHLGSGSYLQRYKTYVTHVQAWRQQFTRLDSVDLRYDGQIIVNPDLEGMPRQPTLTQAAAKAALAAGVKNAAIVNYEKFVAHPAPPAPAKQPEPKSKVAAKSETKTWAKADSKSGLKVAKKPSRKVAHHTAQKSKTETRTVVATNSTASHLSGPIAASGKAADGKTATSRTPAGKTSADSGNPKPAATAPANGHATSAPATTPAKPAQQASGAAVAGDQKKPSPAIKETPRN